MRHKEGKFAQFAKSALLQSLRAMIVTYLIFE